MSQINIRNLSNENDDGAPDIVGVSTFSATSYFVPPKGTTAERPDNPQEGDLRFNTDSASLEYFRGDTLNWTQIEMTSPDLGGGTGSNAGVGARGFQAAGGNPGVNTIIEYLTISTLGDTQDFGDLTLARSSSSNFSSTTRGVIVGGYTAANTNVMDYVTIATLGNAIDFGDMVTNTHTYAPMGTGDRTRGVVQTGLKLPSPYTVFNTIQYNTIATTGNAIDFGDSTQGRSDGGALNSSTRSVFAGGYTGNVPTAGSTNIIDYVTTSTLGNATDFGDILVGKIINDTGASNSTRGLFFGSRSPANINNIEYITIATTGNATDFGDSTFSGGYRCATSSPTRAVEFQSSGSIIDYVEIMTTGNAVDFGDQTTTLNYSTAFSNAHGGL